MDPSFEFDRRDAADEESERNRRHYEAAREQLAIWREVGRRSVGSVQVRVLIRECASSIDAEDEMSKAPFFK